MNSAVKVVKALKVAAKPMTKLIFGIHSVEAALRHQPKSIKMLLFSSHNTRLQGLQAQASQVGIPYRQASRTELDRLSDGGRHQGVIAELNSLPEPTYDLAAVLDQITTIPLLLILDGVQDPHNLGACLRTADAAGVQAVIAPSARAVGMTGTVRKIASGATVPFIQVNNLARCLRELQQRGIWLVGTADEADTDLFSSDLTVPLALVLGAEAKGLRRLTREYCDLLVSIPMAGSVNSLNVSVAAGIALFEARRQRTAKGLALSSTSP